MTIPIFKTVATALGGLSLLVAPLTVATPALAQSHGGHGGGGAHAGGGGGGARVGGGASGFRGSTNIRGGGNRGGGYAQGVYRGGYRGGGYGYGGAYFGGLGLGLALGSAYDYGYGYPGYYGYEDPGYATPVAPCGAWVWAPDQARYVWADQGC